MHIHETSSKELVINGSSDSTYLTEERSIFKPASVLSAARNRNEVVRTIRYFIYGSACLMLFMMAGCAQPDPKEASAACQKLTSPEVEYEDYIVYRTNLPLSVLVLPPTNQSVDADAPYKYVPIITYFLTEAGYDVLPMASVDAYMRENGLPRVVDIHNVPLEQLDEGLGADAVLYIDLEEYRGASIFPFLESDAVVQVRAKLADLDSGAILWVGSARAEEPPNVRFQGTPVRIAAEDATREMLFGREGILFGPHHPNTGQAPHDVQKKEFFGREGPFSRLLGDYHPCAVQDAERHTEAVPK